MRNRFTRPLSRRPSTSQVCEVLQFCEAFRREDGSPIEGLPDYGHIEALLRKWTPDQVKSSICRVAIN